MPTPPTRKPRAAPVAPPVAQRRRTNSALIVGGVLACFAVVLLIAGWDVITAPDDGAPATNLAPTTSRPTHQRSTSATREGPKPPGASSSTNDDALVSDDGETLWASPTAGKPLDLAYLPPGVQIVVALRPAAMLQHPEGAKVLMALGPTGARAIRYLEEVAHVPLSDIEQMLCGIRATTDGTWHTSLVVRLRRPHSGTDIVSKLSSAVKKSHGGEEYWLANERAYFVPMKSDENLLVVAPPDSINELIDLDGSPPPLRRDVERLLAHTDVDRHVTIVIAPNFLFSEGQSMFSGAMARLRSPLFWFLGDELSAVALSLHWDDNFFVELNSAPTLDTSPQRAAKILAERVGQMPDQLEDYVVALEAHPHGRRVIARFPGMVRKLAAYVRTGFEADHATLRAYLPAVAGHNLLMGAELTLAQPPGGALVSSDTEATVSQSAEAGATAEEALKRVTSLSFARDTLEAALQQLSQDIGMEIVIAGPDLQAEGITKNQSFGMDLEGKAAADILVEILRVANPDKTATGPSDERQKLVYVIAPPAAGKPQHILITTRAAAVERGDQLPQAFVATLQ